VFLIKKGKTIPFSTENRGDGLVTFAELISIRDRQSRRKRLGHRSVPKENRKRARRILRSIKSSKEKSILQLVL